MMVDSDKAADVAELVADTEPFNPAPAVAKRIDPAPDKAVATLQSLGMLSVADARWLDPDNDAPPVRALLLVEDPTLPAGSGPAPFMPAGKVCMLAAPGGTGKTQALVQLAVAVASGKPWLGTYAVAEPGRVLLVLGEEGNDEMHRRIRGAVGAMKAWPEAGKIAANLHALSLCGVPAGMVDKDGKQTDFADTLRVGLGAWPDAAWRLIILDPASRFLGPDAEKDNAAATRWVEAVERLTQLPGNPTVLFAHHTGKSGLNGNTDQGAARGSSALTDGVRWQANLDRCLDPAPAGTKGNLIADLVKLRVVKANNCRVQPELLLKRDLAHGGYLRPTDAADRPSIPRTGVAKANAYGNRGGKAKGGDNDDA